MDRLLQRLELSNSPHHEVVADVHQAHGVGELGAERAGGGQVIDRELSADEARAYMQRTFANISIRRMNQALIEKAEAAGTVVTRHG